MIYFKLVSDFLIDVAAFVGGFGLAYFNDKNRRLP